MTHDLSACHEHAHAKTHMNTRTHTVDDGSSESCKGFSACASDGWGGGPWILKVGRAGQGSGEGQAGQALKMAVPWTAPRGRGDGAVG